MDQRTKHNDVPVWHHQYSSNLTCIAIESFEIKQDSSKRKVDILFNKFKINTTGTLYIIR